MLPSLGKRYQARGRARAPFLRAEKFATALPQLFFGDLAE